MRYSFLLVIALFYVLVACQSDAKKATPKKAERPAQPAAPEGDRYTLTPFSTSPNYPNAKIDKMSYKGGKFDFDISGNYTLGEQTSDAKTKMCANSGKGQHIHLIVNKEPYAAKYVSEFEHAVPDGDHQILAFLSRSYHESIKAPGASMAVKATVKNGAITSSSPLTTPSLFYSRPKGTYVGKENYEKVMIDFFLANVDLGTGYSVRANINGEIHTFVKWQPYYIQGLPLGENTITLTLLKDGKAVDSPINPVTRKFTLKADPAG